MLNKWTVRRKIVQKEKRYIVGNVLANTLVSVKGRFRRMRLISFFSLSRWHRQGKFEGA